MPTYVPFETGRNPPSPPPPPIPPPQGRMDTLLTLTAGIEDITASIQDKTASIQDMRRYMDLMCYEMTQGTTQFCRGSENMQRAAQRHMDLLQQRRERRSDHRHCGWIAILRKRRNAGARPTKLRRSSRLAQAWGGRGRKRVPRVRRPG